MKYVRGMHRMEPIASHGEVSWQREQDTGKSKMRERGAQNRAHSIPREVSRQQEQATGTSEMRERGTRNGAHSIPREVYGELL